MVGDVLGMLGIVDAGTSKGVGAIGFISGLGSTCGIFCGSDFALGVMTGFGFLSLFTPRNSSYSSHIP